VKVAYGVLAGMGISSAAHGPLAVAVSVFLLNAVLNIGVETICEGYTEEEIAEARAKAKKKAPGSRRKTR